MSGLIITLPQDLDFIIRLIFIVAAAQLNLCADKHMFKEFWFESKSTNFFKAILGF